MLGSGSASSDLGDGRAVTRFPGDDRDAISGQLWTVDVHTGQQPQLTDAITIKDQTPDWSPDATRITYQATTAVGIAAADRRPDPFRREPVALSSLRPPSPGAGPRAGSGDGLEVDS